MDYENELIVQAIRRAVDLAKETGCDVDLEIQGVSEGVRIVVSKDPLRTGQPHYTVSDDTEDASYRSFSGANGG